MSSPGFLHGARGVVVGVSGEASIGWHTARDGFAETVAWYKARGWKA